MVEKKEKAPVKAAETKPKEIIPLGFKAKLIAIQTELNAPKGQYNSFGQYAYRSNEDILQAVKPLLNKYGLSLTLTDDILQIGERYYLQATASISDDDDNGTTVTGLAREPDNKKGMDSSQITGTASSYARKYALNGLFLIDDNKDADTDEYSRQSKKPANSKQAPYKKAPVTQEKQERNLPIISRENEKILRDKIGEVAQLASLKTGNEIDKDIMVDKVIQATLKTYKPIASLDIFEAKAVEEKALEWHKRYAGK